MKLVHYSHIEITAVEPVIRNRLGSHRGSFMKPIGIWVSDENEYGWIDWCRDQKWGEDGLTHVHDVNLAPDANILYLGSKESVLEFHNNFCFDLFSVLETSIGGQSLLPPGQTRPPMMAIDWDNVAERYQGIMISPYYNGLSSLRYHPDMMWYNVWDCASGCIWDHTAIESIKLRPREGNQK